MPFWIVAIAVAALGLGIRYRIHRVEKSRILAAAEEQGWRQVEVAWRAFPPDRTGRKGERWYRVSYRDGDGRRQERFCKTSLRRGEVQWQ